MPSISWFFKYTPKCPRSGSYLSQNDSSQEIYSTHGSYGCPINFHFTSRLLAHWVESISSMMSSLKRTIRQHSDALEQNGIGSWPILPVGAKNAIWERAHMPISTTPVRPDEGHYKGFHQGSYPYSQEVRNLITSEDVSNTAMFSDCRGCHDYYIFGELMF